MEGKANDDFHIAESPSAVAWSNLASCIDFSAPEEHSAHEVSTCSTGEHSLPVEPTATRFELSSYGDVILSLTIHATTVMQCVLVVSQQWDSPVNVKQLDQKTWIAELVDHGLPTIFIKGNCFNTISYVLIKGKDIDRVVCTVAHIQDKYRRTLFLNTPSIRVDTLFGAKYIFRTLD